MEREREKRDFCPLADMLREVGWGAVVSKEDWDCIRHSHHAQKGVLDATSNRRDLESGDIHEKFKGQIAVTKYKLNTG